MLSFILQKPTPFSYPVILEDEAFSYLWLKNIAEIIF